MSNKKKSLESGRLLGLRTALVLTMSVVAGLIVGGLTYLADGNAARCVLAGIGATAAAAKTLEALIGRT